MAWNDKKQKFVSRQASPHEVNGEEWNFYPMSVKLTFKLKAFAEPLSQLFASFMANTKNDFGTSTKGVRSSDKDIDGFNEYTTQPITEGLAKVRFEQSAGALKRLVDSFFDEANRLLLCEIIMDSLRDEFPRGDKDNPPVLEFANDIDLDIFVASMIGVVKANGGVFGPLAAKAGMDGPTLAGAKEMLQKAAASVNAVATVATPGQA